MKQKILLFVMLFTWGGISMSLHAQQNGVERALLKEKKELKDTMEIEKNGKVFEYTKEYPVLQRKDTKNCTKGKKSVVREPRDVFAAYKDVFPKVFSRERQEELKNDKLHIESPCDMEGNILHVRFHLKRAPNVTLKELLALEKVIMDYKIELEGEKGEKNEYVSMIMGCDFGRLLRMSEARK